MGVRVRGVGGGVGAGDSDCVYVGGEGEVGKVRSERVMVERTTVVRVRVVRVRAVRVRAVRIGCGL
jgi:hypothetical protein